MIPIAFSANALLIFSMVKTKQFHNVSDRFILLLASSDCCVALISQTLVSLLFTRYRSLEVCELETAATIASLFFGHLSGFSILSISIDRFIHMIFLNRCDQILTRGRDLIMMVGCFVLACSAGVVSLLGTVYKKLSSVHGSLMLIDFIGILIISIIYIITYFRIRRHITETAELRQFGLNSPRAGRENSKRPEYVTKLEKTIFLILGTLLLCQIPYMTVGMICFIKEAKSELPLSPHLELTKYATYILVYFYSTLNAVIFLYRNRKCKTFLLVQIMRCVSFVATTSDAKT